MLISNSSPSGHAACIRAMLAEADEVRVAVAFLRTPGARFIVPLLEARLAAGGAVDMFVGTDFFQTDPDALDMLLDLKTRHEGCSVAVARRAPATFHPKIYSARCGERWRSLIGSANLTGGALGANEELSIAIDHQAGDALTGDLGETFARYRASDRFQPLDALLLLQYRSAHAIDRRERAKYEKARDAALPNGIDLDLISAWHARYRADDKAMSELAQRKRARARALRLQNELAALSEGRITERAKQTLRQGLGDLIGSADGAHLWGSANIPRQGSKALEHEREMIQLFALARSVSRRPAAEGYAAVREAANDIPGAGLNMATEMLCTFAPTRYAIYNGNTVGALAALGIEIARHANFRAIGPDRYARICGTINALGQRIGTTNLSDADAFLNWIYWEIKNRRLKPRTR